MTLAELGSCLSEKEKLFIVDLIICLNKARTKFPGNRNRLDALVEEVGEVATALMDNEGEERVHAECVDVACTAMRLALEGDANYPKQVQGMILGSMRLINIGNGKVWLGEAHGGEGGEFPAKDIESLCLKYFGDNF
jgi:hypothetical protein